MFATLFVKNNEGNVGEEASKGLNERELGSTEQTDCNL
jgi:hypothetical protein